MYICFIFVCGSRNSYIDHQHEEYVNMSHGEKYPRTRIRAGLSEIGIRIWRNNVVLLWCHLAIFFIYI